MSQRPMLYIDIRLLYTVHFKACHSGVRITSMALEMNLKYLAPGSRGLILSRCIDQGAMLYTHTPAQNISSEKDNSGFWTTTTPRGTVKAKQVVFACNAYTSAILPMYSNKIIPVRGVLLQDSTYPPSEEAHRDIHSAME